MSAGGNPANPGAARSRAIVVGSIALAAAAAVLFFPGKPAAENAGHSVLPVNVVENSPGPRTKLPPQSPAPDSPAPVSPPLLIADAEQLTTSEIALHLAAWPEGAIHPDLPRWAALLAERGDSAITDLASALATAGSNTARGVLSDALARIGTDQAIQELCTQASRAPDDASRQCIAASFRALSRPASAPMLATLFSEASAGPLVAEASAALRRLTDGTGVQSLADLAQEGGQLHSQRENIFNVLAGLENPEALPALETLAADTTDPGRAAAAATGVAHLKAVIAARRAHP